MERKEMGNTATKIQEIIQKIREEIMATNVTIIHIINNVDLEIPAKEKSKSIMKLSNYNNGLRQALSIIEELVKQ